MSLSTTIIPQTNQLVLKGRGVPRHETAQIAFRGEQCWRIIGPYWEETGLLEDYPLPALNCPVVDLTDADPEKAGKVIRQATSPAGCADVPALVRALMKLGAKVLNSGNVGGTWIETNVAPHTGGVD